jgi:hypothetical protein
MVTALPQSMTQQLQRRRHFLAGNIGNQNPLRHCQGSPGCRENIRR